MSSTYTIEKFRQDIIKYRQKRSVPARFVRALSYDTEIPGIRFDKPLHQVIASTGLPISVYALRTVVLEVKPESIRTFEHLRELCRLAEVHIHVATFRRAACATGAEVIEDW